MVQDAELDCDNPRRFDDLIDEQTPGGLNEQVSARLFKVEMIYPVNCVFHKGPPSYIYCALLNLIRRQGIGKSEYTWSV